MRKAKAELGDDARLVSARRVSAPNTPPVYEVLVTAGPASTPEPAGAGFDELRREIESLRRSIGDLTERRETVTAPEVELLETPFVETYREALGEADLDGVLRLKEK